MGERVLWKQVVWKPGGSQPGAESGAGVQRNRQGSELLKWDWQPIDWSDNPLQAVVKTNKNEVEGELLLNLGFSEHNRRLLGVGNGHNCDFYSENLQKCWVPKRRTQDECSDH